MNRLILIGNGFDLAHGMKTSYGDFIEWCWGRVSDELKVSVIEDEAIKTSLILLKDKNIEKIHSRYTGVLNCIYCRHFYLDFIDDRFDMKNVLKFIKDLNNTSSGNDFFIHISQNYVDKNWSDVEADYYKLLLKHKDDQEEIKKLNKEFLQIKKLLKEYLEIQRIGNYKNDLTEAIMRKSIRVDDLLNINVFETHLSFSLTKLRDEEYLTLLERLGIIDYSIFEKERNTISELLAKRIMHLFKKRNIKHSELFFGNWINFPNQNYFLNFNYTNTLSLYNNPRYSEVNNIHGTLDNVDSMIFGYGDEEANEYAELENSEVRGLLDNVKSINYLNSRNYRDFERFIESEPFQVFIFGMSCGLADRTMLRKIFEHDNCVGIKPFYYEWKDEKTKEKRNNYSELVQNISRCFSDKNKLRSRVVNFEDCEAMPQCKKEEN